MKQRPATNSISKRTKESATQQTSEHAQAEDEAQRFRSSPELSPQQGTCKSNGLRIESIDENRQKAQSADEVLKRTDALARLYRHIDLFLKSIDHEY